MWMSPFAYGGPSCRTNRFAPGRAALRATSFSKTPCACHSRRISGSRCGRLAFIGKPVFGRWIVSL